MVNQNPLLIQVKRKKEDEAHCTSWSETIIDLNYCWWFTGQEGKCEMTHRLPPTLPPPLSFFSLPLSPPQHWARVSLCLYTCVCVWKNESKSDIEQYKMRWEITFYSPVRWWPSSAFTRFLLNTHRKRDEKTRRKTNVTAMRHSCIHVKMCFCITTHWSFDVAHNIHRQMIRSRHRLMQSLLFSPLPDSPLFKCTYNCCLCISSVSLMTGNCWVHRRLLTVLHSNEREKKIHRTSKSPVFMGLCSCLSLCQAILVKWILFFFFYFLE